MFFFCCISADFRWVDVQRPPQRLEEEEPKRWRMSTFLHKVWPGSAAQRQTPRCNRTGVQPMVPAQMQFFSFFFFVSAALLLELFITPQRWDFQRELLIGIRMKFCEDGGGDILFWDFFFFFFLIDVSRAAPIWAPEGNENALNSHSTTWGGITDALRRLLRL